jgi:two-component system invasion response regulator UvrY
MTEKITILIAEDHSLVREAWAYMLNNDARFRVIAETADGNEAIELARELKPDVVILDINLKGKSGIDAVPLILLHSPGSRVLGVSWLTHPAYSRRMLQNGALGYVCKNSPGHEMTTAIIEVNAGRKYICDETRNMYESVMSGKITNKGINALSQREVEVIEEIKKGHSSKEIAETLHISKKTIEVHRYNIMRKLNLRNVASLVNYVNHSQLDLDERFAV